MKKFYFAIVAMMLSIVANATDYYLIGGFNNWELAQENCKFTDAGDGTYMLDYQGTLTSEFKINNGTWDDANTFGGGGTLTPGTEYTLYSPGGNITLAENIDNPHIVFNPSAKTLLITGQAVEVKVRYGIHGQIFGNASWETVDFEQHEDGLWVITASVVPGDFGIKVMDAGSGAQVGWLSSADASNVINAEQLGTALNVKENGTNWYSTISGEVTIAFNPEAMTLTITGQATEAKLKYGIHGQIFGNPAWETVDMEKGEDGLWSVSGNIVPGLFGIKVSDEETGEQVNWYSSADASSDINTEQLGVSLNVKSEGSNWNSSLTGAYKLTFDPQNMVLVVTGDPSGIEDVEINSNAIEVSRFTIDGRSISEPQKGVNIIRYSNGSVSKVIVR